MPTNLCTDKFYSPDQRMGQAGHDDRNTFHRSYQSTNAGVDGQATFLGDERRNAVNDAFRELTVPRNPNLWQSLPAEKQYEIENSQKWLDLEEQMANLKLEKSDPDCKRKQQSKLRTAKTRLMRKELRKWQKKAAVQAWRSARLPPRDLQSMQLHDAGARTLIKEYVRS